MARKNEHNRLKHLLTSYEIKNKEIYDKKLQKIMDHNRLLSIKLEKEKKECDNKILINKGINYIIKEQNKFIDLSFPNLWKQVMKNSLFPNEIIIKIYSFSQEKTNLFKKNIILLPYMYFGIDFALLTPYIKKTTIVKRRKYSYSDYEFLNDIDNFDDFDDSFDDSFDYSDIEYNQFTTLQNKFSIKFIK